MKFTLEVDSENEAFNDSGELEIARILEEVRNQVLNGKAEGAIMDVNGNKVGTWELTRTA